MLKYLKLKNFKSFKDAELTLGPFTVLAGTNASGKSNLREAFRFLHAVARGYSLPDIIGQKYGEGGERQWSGIRGGPSESPFYGERKFTIAIGMMFESSNGTPVDAEYSITVELLGSANHPSLLAETFSIDHDVIFDARVEDRKLVINYRSQTTTTVRSETARIGPKGSVSSSVWEGITETILGQPESFTPIMDEPQAEITLWLLLHTRILLKSMRFMELHPDAMRRPSLAGQTVLGSQGENLSSVLESICRIPDKKEQLLAWLNELSPMDVSNFAFEKSLGGYTQIVLLDKSGKQTSIFSASDGTLRFLAILAALLGPKPPKFFFLEELENGIHPSRLRLLIDLIEKQVAKGNTQLVATTHSPQLLAQLSPESLEHASVTYRLEGQPDTRVKRILDIPEARRVIEEQDLARLHTAGWLEDVLIFSEEEQEVAK